MFCRTAGSRTGRPDGPPVVVFEQHEGIPSVHRPAPPTRSRQAPNDEAPTSGPTPDTRSVQFFPAILCNLKSAMTEAGLPHCVTTPACSHSACATSADPLYLLALADSSRSEHDLLSS